MGKMFGEPLMIITAGGMGLFQAFLEVLIAFHVPMTGQQQMALTTLVGIILGLMARTQTTPMATLPVGVAAQIAANAAPPAASMPPNVPMPSVVAPPVMPPVVPPVGQSVGPGTIHLGGNPVKDKTP